MIIMLIIELQILKLPDKSFTANSHKNLIE